MELATVLNLSVTTFKIETKDGFFIDSVWVAEDLNTDAILGGSSLSAFQALTIRYGGHLPPLEVKEVRIESSTFANCAPVSCFPITPKTPCRAPSRRQSPEDKAFIKEETEKLFREGKIQHSNSPWCSQAFVVCEKGKEPRMVIDYAQTVSRDTPLDTYPIPW